MKKKLFVVSYHYLDGEHEYCERSYYRATPKRLERQIRHDLADFSGKAEKEIIWSLENQNATKDEAFVWDTNEARIVSTSAEEISSLDDLRFWNL